MVSKLFAYSSILTTYIPIYAITFLTKRTSILSFIINGNLFQVGTLIKLLFKPKAILKTTNQLSEACRPLIWSSKRLFISPFILSSYLHHEDAIISLFYQLHGIWYKEILSTSSNSHC